MRPIERHLDVMQEARLIYDRLASGGWEIVEAKLSSYDIPTMQMIVSYNLLWISEKLLTRGLDSEFRGCYRRMQLRLDELRKRTLSRHVEQKRIDLNLTGYPKHQAQCVLDGIDPLTFHQWEELGESRDSDTS